MAIKIPAHCRGVSAGAMRQVKQQGFSTNTRDGGVFSDDFVKGRLIGNMSSYLAKREPLGNYMSALENTAKEINEVTQAITASSRAMVDSAVDANKRLADVTGKLRDGTEKLGVAMDKLSKIANNASFAETAKTAESLVNSLERLAALQQSGLLDKVIQAMTARRD